MTGRRWTDPDRVDEDEQTAADLSSGSLRTFMAPDSRPGTMPSDTQRARLQQLRADLEIRAGVTASALGRAGCGG